LKAIPFWYIQPSSSPWQHVQMILVAYFCIVAKYLKKLKNAILRDSLHPNEEEEEEEEDSSRVSLLRAKSYYSLFSILASCSCGGIGDHWKLACLSSW